MTSGCLWTLAAFLHALHGPGVGCDMGGRTTSTRCTQRAGQGLVCKTSTYEPWWDCEIDPHAFAYDLDGDLDIDLQDFQLLQQRWGQCCEQ